MGSLGHWVLRCVQRACRGLLLDRRARSFAGGAGATDRGSEAHARGLRKWGAWVAACAAAVEGAVSGSYALMGGDGTGWGGVRAAGVNAELAHLPAAAVAAVALGSDAAFGPTVSSRQQDDRLALLSSWCDVLNAHAAALRAARASELSEMEARPADAATAFAADGSSQPWAQPEAEDSPPRWAVARAAAAAANARVSLLLASAAGAASTGLAGPSLADTGVLLRALPAGARLALRAVVSLVACRLGDASAAVRAAALSCVSGLGPASVLLLPTMPLLLTRRLLVPRSIAGGATTTERLLGVFAAAPVQTGGLSHLAPTTSSHQHARPADGMAVAASTKAVSRRLADVGMCRSAVGAALVVVGPSYPGQSRRAIRALTVLEAELLGAESSAAVRAEAAAVLARWFRFLQQSCLASGLAGDSAHVLVGLCVRACLAGLWAAFVRGQAPRRECAAAMAGAGEDGLRSVLAAAAAALACGVVDGADLPLSLSAGEGRMWRLGSQCQQAACRALALLPLPADEGGVAACGAGGAECGAACGADGHDARREEQAPEAHEPGRGQDAAVAPRGGHKPGTGSRAAAVLERVGRVCACLRAVIAGASARPPAQEPRAPPRGVRGEVAPLVAGAAVRALGRLAVRARHRRLRWAGSDVVLLGEAVASLRASAVVASMAAVLLSGAAEEVLTEAARTLAELGPDGELCLTEVALHGMLPGRAAHGAPGPSQRGTAAASLSSSSSGSSPRGSGRRMTRARAHAARALGLCNARPIATLLLLASGGSSRARVPASVARAAGRAMAATGVRQLAAMAAEATPRKQARFTALAERCASHLGYGARGSETCSRLAEALRDLAAGPEMESELNTAATLSPM